MFQKHNEYKKDQLPGGKLWDPDDATKAILAQLKPHNDSSESILGYNDWLTTALPNLSQQTLSALTEVTYNKTVDWLNSQPDEKQQEVVDLAVSERRTLQKTRKEHEKQITEKRIQQKLQEAEKLKEKAERLAQERVALHQETLITTPEQLDAEIEEIEKLPLTASKKRAETLALIKTQIKIRKKVLGQKNAHITFTVKRKAKPLCELISELKVLLTEDDPQHDIEKTLQCKSLCRAIARRPHTLLNAKIRHRFINSDRTLQFYDGQIINYDHKSKKFTIQYDDDVCNFTIEELVEDCRTEDFVVL